VADFVQAGNENPGGMTRGSKREGAIARQAQPRELIIYAKLVGHWRYARLSALRLDAIAPELFGLGKLVSEDRMHLGLRRIDPLSSRTGLIGHLGQSESSLN
jgi:hypothetical protein